jgi:hypothetical protein
MSELDTLVQEVGARNVRPLSAEQQERRKKVSFMEYDADADATMSLDQAKRLRDAAELGVSSTRFDSDSEFFGIWYCVLDDWPEVTVRFAGEISEHGYLDAVFLVYDELDDEDVQDFREYCVLHFKRWMDENPEDNEGICPVCDERITISHEMFRDTDRDPSLWAAPDEFDFREYPHFGKCVRLWWDD